MDMIEILNKACDCINQDNIDGANTLLNKLRAKKETPTKNYYLAILLRDLGHKIKNMEYINESIEKLEELKENSFEDINFNLGTAYFIKWELEKENETYLTLDHEHSLLKAKKLLKREIIKNDNYDFRKTNINLANTYNNIGRHIEAIEYYDYVMNETGSAYAMLNKGIGLYKYSLFLHNPTPILSEAYYYFKQILNDTRSSSEMKRKAKAYYDDIKWLFDENILEEHIESERIRYSNDFFEGFMINFCLDYKLFLNLDNFCQLCQNSIGDTIDIEKLITNISGELKNEKYDVLSSYLNQIKMDFVSARFLLILSQSNHFDLNIITKYTYISNTSFNEEHDMRIQLLKDSFNNFFNILDKIAFFINEYLNLEIKKHDVDFRKVWFNFNELSKNKNKKIKTKKKIHEKLKNLDNAGLNALYDIYLELDDKNDKKYLRDTRNALTHRYLRITHDKKGNDEKTPVEIKNETIELAIIVKNAIIYLMSLIKINEEYNTE